jgi:branched-chain amino acid transport system ATP-binding protein
LQIAALGADVLGVDVAARFVDASRVDAVDAHAERVSFQVADVQTDPLPGPFDAAYSRFGVMFFASPVAAFRNVRRSLTPTGRIAFVVWRRREDNPWLHVAERVVRAHYAGDDITGKPPFRLVQRGLAMVPEGRGVFGALTIEENLQMGAYIRSDGDGVKADIERVFQLFPRLKERRRQTAGTLSGGEQQMLAIGRAMMSRPKLLLLDEPSMGLAPLMVQKVFETVQTISSEGVTILLIEQNAKLALEVSRRGYVMESGEITLEGEAKSLLHDPKVREAYLGETIAP